MHHQIIDLKNIVIGVIGGIPNDLFHYTSQSGLIGIMKSQSIWASSNQFLNDQQELVLATKYARTRIDQLKQNTVNTLELAHLDEMRGRLVGLEWMNIFVASFCSKGDLLSQWRAYTGQTSGFSIGLNTAELEVVGAQSGFYLLPCAYGPSIQVNAVNKVVDTYSALGSDLAEYTDLLGVIGCMVKHSAFAEEQEWRLISIPDHKMISTTPRLDLHFRPGPTTMVPYVSIPLKNQKDGSYPIKEFISGPTPHPSLASRAMGMLNMSTLGKAAAFRPSTVPYRTW